MIITMGISSRHYRSRPSSYQGHGGAEESEEGAKDHGESFRVGGGEIFNEAYLGLLPSALGKRGEENEGGELHRRSSMSFL